MNEYYDKGMIALLPSTSDWCRIDLPHLTIAYLGAVDELMLSNQNELTKMAMDVSLSFEPFSLGVMSVEEFGTEERVDVLLLASTPPLQQIHRRFEPWDVSEHSFTPHCTIGPKGSVVGTTVPMALTFDRIVVTWGEENTVFKLVG